MKRGLLFLLGLIIGFTPMLSFAPPMPGVSKVETALDPELNRYLIVYQKRVEDPAGTAVYGRFADKSGDFSGDEFEISDKVSVQGSPGVSYDTVYRKYIVVWEDSRDLALTSNDIWGQIVNQNGTLDGNNFAIGQGATYDWNPVVTNDSVNHRFLVVWTTDSGVELSYDILGRIVNSDASFVTDQFNITNNVASQYNASLAFDSLVKMYLVVWYDERNTSDSTLGDIYGKFVDENGSAGSDIVISNGSDYQYEPSVVSDPVNHRFLVTWHDVRNNLSTGFDIYGQIIDLNGSAYGALPNENIPICDEASHQMYPDIAFSDKLQSFLTVWTDSRNQIVEPEITMAKLAWPVEDLFGRYISLTGEMSEGSIAILEDGKYKQQVSLAANSNCSNFLAAYSFMNEDTSTNELGAKLIGDPCSQDPTIPQLVSPENGKTGVGSSVTLKWNESTDPDGDSVSYNASICKNDEFSGCVDITVASLSKPNDNVVIAGFGWLPVLLLTTAVAASLKYRKKVFIGIVFVVLAGYLLVQSGCGSSRTSYKLEGLDSASTYYWKITATDGKGGITQSETWSFTTK